MLGDGSVALGYAFFSGGAHCCSTVTVVTLGAQGRQLLQAELGNAGGLKPVQLGDDGPLQLLSASDVLAYFDDLSFVASPFLPLIFRYDGSRYVEATGAYPAYLRAQLDAGARPARDAAGSGADAGRASDLAQLEHESRGAARLRPVRAAGRRAGRAGGARAELSPVGRRLARDARRRRAGARCSSAIAA